MIFKPTILARGRRRALLPSNAKGNAVLSLPDMAILSVLALLVFGEQKLPGIMRQAGRIMREVQNTSQSFIREMERAADVNEAPKPKPVATDDEGHPPSEVGPASGEGAEK
jgi:Sec-independent protein translocase protein TatA